MVSEAIKSLKRKYKNQDGVKIGRDLIQPCLKECVKYRRGTGTFSSSAFKAYIGAIDHFIHDEIKIEILCSPKIDDILLRSLEKCATSYDRDKILQRTTNELLLAAAGCKSDPDRADYRSMLLSYLIANNKLEIKIALPLSNPSIQTFDSDDDDFDMDDINSRAMYHIKYGYFVFPDKSIVAFEGSVNESDTAFNHNTEKATVYRSWDEYDVKSGRLNDVIEDLDKDWEGKNNDIRIYSIDAESLQIIRDHALSKRPQNPHKINPLTRPHQPDQTTPEQVISDEDKKKWRHQDEAKQIFLEKKAGILAMATGSGKTKTAINIANYLFKENLIDSVIITMVGNPLLAQWDGELLQDSETRKRNVIRHYDKQKNMQSFITDPRERILLITSDRLGEFIPFYSDDKASRTLIIFDEVHDMGAPVKKENTAGKLKKFIYRLGLSATPERGEFDEDGTNFLFNEIGPVIFDFGIEKAIERGILVEFDYHPLIFQLTKEENEKIRAIIASKYSRNQEGRKQSEKEIMIKISNVKKQSQNMLLVFDNYLREKGIDFLNRSIIFVHSKAYGIEVAKIMSERGLTNFNTFYDDEKDDKNLKKLAEGTIQCLITCHKVSQGIDIKSLNSVIIFASAVTRRETIQRLGRALRTEENNPNKRAFLLDFCVLDEGKEGKEKSDTKRMKWLTELANSKKKE